MLVLGMLFKRAGVSNRSYLTAAALFFCLNTVATSKHKLEIDLSPSLKKVVCKAALAKMMKKETNLHQYGDAQVSVFSPSEVFSQTNLEWVEQMGFWSRERKNFERKIGEVLAKKSTFADDPITSSVFGILEEPAKKSNPLICFLRGHSCLTQGPFYDAGTTPYRIDWDHVISVFIKQAKEDSFKRSNRNRPVPPRIFIDARPISAWHVGSEDYLLRVLFHEMSHHATEAVFIEWIESNIWLKSHGHQPDKLFDQYVRESESDLFAGPVVGSKLHLIFSEGTAQIVESKIIGLLGENLSPAETEEDLVKAFVKGRYSRAGQQLVQDGFDFDGQIQEIKAGQIAPLARRIYDLMQGTISKTNQARGRNLKL